MPDVTFGEWFVIGTVVAFVVTAGWWPSAGGWVARRLSGRSRG